MPRGRHRHSPPLHRLLPPSLVAGTALVCAAGAWLFAEPVVLRGLVAAAAVTAVTGAYVMRRWDRVAGKRVAELTRARASDEWRYDERIAELESDLEESRELRGKLETKLRAKRTELAALRSEHAALLRRYATAETERASALEGRRRLALEAAAPTKALPPSAASAASSASSADAPAVGGGASRVTAPGPALYLRAARALENLQRNAEAQRSEGASGGRPVPPGPGGGGPGGPGAARVPDAGEEASAAQEGSGAQQSGDAQRPGGAQRSGAAQRSGGAVEAPVPQAPGVGAAGSGDGPRHYAVPAAAAVVPHAPVRRPAVGGFDFFGTGPKAVAAAPSPAALEAVRAVQHEDLADVVGPEALAAHRAAEPGNGETGETGETGESEENVASASAEPHPEEPEAREEREEAAEPGATQDGPAGEDRAVGEVIDLTAHDETEQIDVAELRTAIS